MEVSAMAYYVVDGHAVESCGRWWVDNARAARVVAEVVPIVTFDGDAEGAPDFTAWVPPECFYSRLDGVRVKRIEVSEPRPERPTYLLMVEPFEMGTAKESAVKPLEEAAEAFAAWQDYYELETLESDGLSAALNHVLYECCDVIQAACNLMWRMGATEPQVMAAMQAVTRQNEARGRYGAE
jgi:hypothetical protein